MNDPSRLHEETDNDLERLLLRAGRSYGSSTEARVKTLAALGLTGSAALAVGAASAAPLAAAGKLTWTKLLLAATAIGAVTAVPVVYTTWNRHRTSGTAPAAVAASRPAPAIQEVAAPSNATAGAPAAVESPRSSASRANPRAARHARDTAGVRAGDGRTKSDAATLTEELDALDAARAALAGGDAQGALARLDAYTRGYPRGGLELEAEILRIDALAKSGRTLAATKRAETFVRRHPNSVLAPRARRYIDE